VLVQENDSAGETAPELAVLLHQMAAAESRFAASSVMFTCFDPANTAMFTMQSPTFAAGFMYMTSPVKRCQAKAPASALTGPANRE
jgi:hypothetical protein